MAVFIVNHNKNQLLNEHDSVILVVKTLTKITREHRFMGTKCRIRKHSGQESWLRVDKGLYPRLLTLTYGS
jgi:hypothetical protein